MVPRCLFLACVLFAFAVECCSGACFVQTPLGKFRGEYFSTFPSCTYKGIPFAQPPVGELRFKPPKEVGRNKNGTMEVTKFGPACIQKCGLQHPELTCAPTMSEDCLYLNVYTPATTTQYSESAPFESRKLLDSTTLGKRKLLPVLLFFHGGNFIGGTASALIYHGSRWANENNAIIVTANYRLGVLGGLYTKRAGINGNFQLMDQRMAMKWVKENIKGFGGDPAGVTIFGQSAGGFSVAAHLASPKSWPYFSKAISHSDPFALPTEHESKLKLISDIVVEKLNCAHFTNPQDELKCLQNAPAEDVLAAQRASHFPVTRGILHAFMPWTPVVEKDELPMSPMEAAKTGNLANKPTMVGTVANESVQYIWKASAKPLSYDAFVLYLEGIFGPVDVKKILKYYGKPPADQVKQGDVRLFMSRIGTDYIFTCANKRFAKDAAKSNKDVYVYYFDHLLSYNEYFQGKWYPECVDWVCHGSELPVLFATEYLESDPKKPSPTFEEMILSNQMRAIWTNFARTGNPNAPVAIPQTGTSNSPIALLKGLSSTDDETIVLSTAGTHSQRDMLAQTCALADEIGYEKN